MAASNATAKAGSAFERRFNQAREASALQATKASSEEATVPSRKTCEMCGAPQGSNDDWLSFVENLDSAAFKALTLAVQDRQQQELHEEGKRSSQEVAGLLSQSVPTLRPSTPMHPEVDQLAQTLHQKNYSYEDGVLYREGHQVDLYTSSEEEFEDDGEGPIDSPVADMPPLADVVGFGGRPPTASGQMGQMTGADGEQSSSTTEGDVQDEMDDLDESIASCSSFSANTSPADSPIEPNRRPWLLNGPDAPEEPDLTEMASALEDALRDE